MTASGATSKTGPARALEHVRVLDLGIITAGAATTQMLADFGADVIKIESPTYFDPFRRWTQVASAGGGQAGIDASPPFQTVNRNKRGVGIDLKTPEGRDLFLELVATADVVVENFRRGVLERLGLGFDALKAVKPDIVLASLTSQGTEGPEAGYASFGSTLEGIGGLMSVMGYDAETPRWSGTNVNYPDQLVSLMAPGAILAALRQRDLTGDPIHLDFSQRESVTFLLGEYLIDEALTGEVRPPQANQHPVQAPQGVYPCQGAEQWIAITVGTEAQWTWLVSTLGTTLKDDRFATLALRRANHEALDATIARATAQRNRDDLAYRLRGGGLAVSAVLNAAEVLDDAQFAALGYFQTVESDAVATHRQRGFGARMSATPGEIRRPAPKLGEHSREVLAEVLGCPPDRIAALVESGAVFTGNR